jgi:hypothetical protein
MDKHTEIAQRVYRDFKKKNANLLCCFQSSEAETIEIISAAASMDEDIREIIVSLLGHMKNPDYAKTAESMLYSTLYASLAKELVNAFNRGILTLSMKFTDLADQEFCELRYVASIEQRPAAVAPPKSVAQLLEEEVIADFNGGLSASKMRLKMNDRAYKACYDRLAETNRLQSQITQLHDGREIGS